LLFTKTIKKQKTMGGTQPPRLRLTVSARGSHSFVATGGIEKTNTHWSAPLGSISEREARGSQYIQKK